MLGFGFICASCICIFNCICATTSHGRVGSTLPYPLQRYSHSDLISAAFAPFDLYWYNVQQLSYDGVGTYYQRPKTSMPVWFYIRAAFAPVVFAFVSVCVSTHLCYPHPKTSMPVWFDIRAPFAPELLSPTFAGKTAVSHQQIQSTRQTGKVWNIDM